MLSPRGERWEQYPSVSVGLGVAGWFFEGRFGVQGVTGWLTTSESWVLLLYRDSAAQSFTE